MQTIFYGTLGNIHSAEGQLPICALPKFTISQSETSSIVLIHMNVVPRSTKNTNGGTEN